VRRIDILNVVRVDIVYATSESSMQLPEFKAFDFVSVVTKVKRKRQRMMRNDESMMYCDHRVTCMYAVCDKVNQRMK
jgi:hypothetical protein